MKTLLEAMKSLQENKSNLIRDELEKALKDGKIIEITGKEGYTPSKFYMEDGKIYVQSDALGSTWIEHPEQSIEKTLDHFEDMDKEGFIINIK